MCYFRHIGLLDDQQETSESQMNCSLMMSPELSDEQKQAIRNTPKFLGFSRRPTKVDSREDECETQDFTGDHAPINQRAYRVSPTERRIIHEEVQKMLDEGIVQPSESPWSSPVVLEAGLKLNSKKCLFFAAQEVKILGHLVSSNGVRPDPDKIKASLLKSGVEFHWGPEEVEAFHSLKKALTSIPVLGMYDERASQKSILMQAGTVSEPSLVQIQNNVEKVIAYASRTLTKSRKELFHHRKGMSCHRMGYQQIPAVHIRKHFTVVTDHHSLCWLMNLKDPSGRLARWALRLQEHDFDVKI
ncbi:transposon Ty3-I Gag-Pol polyprotein [Trichonephila clavipes]|nr:transposon Ty3-I Gag-Pol polyprotein [Trichonephila clavipes]